MKYVKTQTWFLLIIFVFCLFYFQSKADPIQLKMIEFGRSKTQTEHTSDLMAQLPAQFLVATLSGFKEVVAGALWVRADDFFHKGDFESIVPIVRAVTWLDPHNIDVFSTGAWHLDYNFVDNNSISDKRYIPSSIALLKEGIANNPDQWDLYFDLAWTHYNKKLYDFETGLKYMEIAVAKEGFDPNTGEKRARPDFVDRMLAHQYVKVGKLDKAIEHWEKATKRTKELINSSEGKRLFVDQSSFSVIDRNLSLLYLRIAYRYGDMDAYRKGLEVFERVIEKNASPNVSEEKKAYKRAKADYEKRLAQGGFIGDAQKPLDAGFTVQWRRVGPRKLEIKGKINLVNAEEYKDMVSEAITNWYSDNQKQSAEMRVQWRDGSRVIWKLTDFDYELPNPKSFSYQIDRTQTVQWDTLYVSGGQFNDVIDFSDTAFYPFNSDKYRLEVYYIPRDPCAPDFIQDRIGFLGEALQDPHLDKNFLPGFNVLKKEFIIHRDEIL
ncbi:MAG: hypothetical protein SNJ70_05080 [Armatimonadota bacterium]